MDWPIRIKHYVRIQVGISYLRCLYSIPHKCYAIATWCLFTLSLFAIVDVRYCDVSYCWRSHSSWTNYRVHTYIWKNLFLLPLIVYRMRYDDWKSNSCRIIQLYHVFLRNTGDILIIFWYFFLYSTRLKARGIQKKIPKNCSNIHRYFIKNHGITGNYHKHQNEIHSITILSPFDVLW